MSFAKRPSSNALGSRSAGDPKEHAAQDSRAPCPGMSPLVRPPPPHPPAGMRCLRAPGGQGGGGRGVSTCLERVACVG